ncbi:MAG: hypothetical protein JXA24_04390 [Proteobacteria bacterium]|nr:hypothetical protein [Pseudomonadota bacterium]
MKTQFSKSLAWLEKYLIRVHKKMPTMAMPRLVRSFIPNPKKHHRTLGNCCLEERSITLATHTNKVLYKEGKKRWVLTPLSHLEILQTFAHELSHFGYEEHGYEQEWYGRTIFNTFGITEPCPHCNGKGRIPARYENFDK